jgi:hypothetical protein
MSTRPPSLGRGLAALIPTDVLHVGSETSAPALRVVSLDRIRPNPEQPRTHFFGPALDELAESIREHGILTPLLVRRDPESRDFVLIAGERRLRAAGSPGSRKFRCSCARTWTIASSSSSRSSRICSARISIRSRPPKPTTGSARSSD